ncbi:MAG TPA: IS200/IS605 family transposase [Paludibacteraceae bacterium]|nr:IS200/IS605 family transposase [Paludibacteraceae bacterium]
MEDEHIYKRYNKTLLLYHIVLPIKYRKKMITESIGNSLKCICMEISERYEINFIEIGYEEDDVHFLLQSVPTYSVSTIVTKLKSS